MFLVDAQIAKPEKIFAEFVGEVPAMHCQHLSPQCDPTHSKSISPLSANIISSSITGAVV